MCPRQMLVVLLLLASAAAIAGCGGGDGNASTDRGAATDEQSTASNSLVQAQDLPAGARPVEKLPSGPCSPLRILKSDKSQAAESPMFAIARVRVQEAVGVFAASGPAVAAYDALNAKKRLGCIRESIALQGALQGGVSVKV